METTSSLTNLVAAPTTVLTSDVLPTENRIPSIFGNGDDTANLSVVANDILNFRITSVLAVTDNNNDGDHRGHHDDDDDDKKGPKVPRDASADGRRDSAREHKQSHKEHKHKRSHKEHEHKRPHTHNAQKQLLRGIDTKLDEVKDMLGSITSPGNDIQQQIDSLKQQLDTVAQAVCLSLDPDKSLSLPIGTCTRIAFVTSTVHQGNLGGLAGADTICNNLAQQAGLPGTYLAWLSGADASPSERFAKTKLAYVGTDGLLIANGYADLIGKCPGLC